MGKIIALLGDQTIRGTIVMVPCMTATLNGVPIVTVGSQIVHKIPLPPPPVDSIAAPTPGVGVLLNNMPVICVGATTVLGSPILPMGLTTAMIE